MQNKQCFFYRSVVTEQSFCFLLFNKYIVVLVTITQELLRHQNFFSVSMGFQDKYMDFISFGDETETVLVLM